MSLIDQVSSDASNLAIGHAWVQQYLIAKEHISQIVNL